MRCRRVKNFIEFLHLIVFHKLLPSLDLRNVKWDEFFFYNQFASSRNEIRSAGSAESFNFLSAIKWYWIWYIYYANRFNGKWLFENEVFIPPGWDMKKAATFTHSLINSSWLDYLCRFVRFSEILFFEHWEYRSNKRANHITSIYFNIQFQLILPSYQYMEKNMLEKRLHIQIQKHKWAGKFLLFAGNSLHTHRCFSCVYVLTWEILGILKIRFKFNYHSQRNGWEILSAAFHMKIHWSSTFLHSYASLAIRKLRNRTQIRLKNQCQSKYFIWKIEKRILVCWSPVMRLSTSRKCSTFPKLPYANENEERFCRFSAAI